MDEEVKEALPVRIIDSFNNIEESEFWPSEVTEVKDKLIGPLTFKELSEILNSSYRNNVNQIDARIQSYKGEYDKYLKNIQGMPNVFSYDVDYI